MKKFLCLLAFALLNTSAANADIIISEVQAGGSGAVYGADWFELTNTGNSDVSLVGWRIDDSSNTFATGSEFRGVTSIAAGQSVIFFEGNAAGSTDGTIQTAFINAWFGGVAPANFVNGFYGGSGLGLSTGGDAVNIFDNNQVKVAGVTFGASAAGFTFDNTAGLNNSIISTLSSVGVNGAFTSSNGSEVGSPGVQSITAVPEPTSIALMLVGSAGLIARRRLVNRNKK
jgi:hypothetical protein